LKPRTKLGALVKTILNEASDLRRLRLSSLDPAELDKTLWDTLATNERLMPHLHLSVQAGHDLVLKRMKRRHSRRDVVSCVQKARHLRPGVTLGADLIAGFPTETEQMFESTQALVEECKFEFLHVFPYSIRKNTPAARMPMVPVGIRAERARILRATGWKIKHSLFKQSLGSCSRVLLEKPNFGRTENNLPVKLSTQGLSNSIEKVLLTEIVDQALLGRIV
jgi:threonylcarbamoyladenosine tRNA methylthiotransferase MtaB